MSVLVYTGGYKAVAKSGVGQALLHQREALELAGVPLAEKWGAGAGVVHINTVLPGSVLAAMRAKLTGKKVVYYAHSTMEDFRNSFFGSNLLAPLFRRWIAFCYRRGDVVLTPTPYSESIIRGYGLNKPIYHISNGVDTSFFSPSAQRREAFRKRWGLTPEDRVVISVGHFMERKGLPDYIEMARRMPTAHFFWFGHTDRALLTPEVRDAMDNAPANLVFPGFVDKEALREAYCGADVFAFLSHEETEGIVVLEALACGVPTVVRDIPVYDGWLENGKNVYKAAELDGLQAAVEGLLDGTLPSLAPAGRKTARMRSLGAVGRRLREIYEEQGLDGRAQTQGALPWRFPPPEAEPDWPYTAEKSKVPRFCRGTFSHEKNGAKQAAQKRRCQAAE